MGKGVPGHASCASAEGGLGTGRQSSKDAQPLTRPTVSCALTCSLKGSSVFILAADEDWKCLLFFALGPVIRGSHSGHQDFEWAHSVQLSSLKKKVLASVHLTRQDCWLGWCGVLMVLLWQSLWVSCLYCRPYHTGGLKSVVLTAQLRPWKMRGVSVRSGACCKLKVGPLILSSLWLEPEFQGSCGLGSCGKVSGNWNN